MNNQSPQERLHALDAVRGIALLLGIVLHGTMSFMPGLAATGYPIADQSQSDSLGVLFYLIHVFRMSTFFLIAGFFAHLVYHRRGTKAFIKDRSKRIIVPLLSFFIPVSVAVFGVIAWAVFKNYGTFQADVALEPPAGNGQTMNFPLMHFWFLYILIWLYAIVLLVRPIFVKLDVKQRLITLIDKFYAIIFNSYCAAFIFALPVAYFLYLIPDWLWWGGVPTPDQSLIPQWSALAIYFYMFLLGWLLDRQRHCLQTIRKQWLINLVLGLATVACCLSIAGWQSDFFANPTSDWHLAYAGLYAISLVALSLAFIGGGLVFFSKENPIIRYLADASYWIYVLHLPLVFALQTLLMDTPWHWTIKFPLIIVLTAIPLVLTYHWLVRSTWIGAIMNGKRYPRVWPGNQTPLPAN